jgi:hypothetical protein
MSQNEQNDKDYADKMLSGLAPFEASAELRRMVAEIPLRHPRRAFRWWPFGELWQPGLLLAAAATLGFFSGNSWLALREANAPRPMDSALSALSLEESSDPEEELSALDNEAELDELLVLATAGDPANDAFSYLDEAESSETEQETY